MRAEIVPKVERRDLINYAFVSQGIFGANDLLAAILPLIQPIVSELDGQLFKPTELAEKIADKKGRLAKLMAAKTSHEDIVTQLYLATVTRYPSQAEMNYTKQTLAESQSPKEFYEDLLWALINSKQFLFVR